jgi:glycosyltransferase involved in cell wall biosynthesis
MSGEAEFFAKSNDSYKMKILYILPFVPWPVKVRSFNLVPRLARRHEIYLVCVSSVAPSTEQIQWLNRYCQKVVHVPHPVWKGFAQCVLALPRNTPLRIAYCRSKAAHDEVQRVYREVRPDIVYVERWRALQYVPEDAKGSILCDPTDSMTLYNRRLMQAGIWWEKLIGWIEFKRFLRYEGQLARQANACVFCSKVDMDCVKEHAPEAACELVPNAVDCGKYFFKNASEEEPETVIFTGNFKYRPNCHAIEFFMNKIFPLVQRKVPRVKFLAVGNGASQELRGYCGRAGFEAIDFVADLRPYLAKATVVVAPLTVGSGVSNKLAEGFAVGTPVVATPLACGDLPVKSGEQLLIGATADEFAEHVVTLLLDAELRKEMAVRARRLVEEQYDWEITARKMEVLMERLSGISTSDRSRREFVTA